MRLDIQSQFLYPNEHVYFEYSKWSRFKLGRAMVRFPSINIDDPVLAYSWQEEIAS